MGGNRQRGRSAGRGNRGEAGESARERATGCSLCAGPISSDSRGIGQPQWLCSRPKSLPSPWQRCHGDGGAMRSPVGRSWRTPGDAPPARPTSESCRVARVLRPPRVEYVTETIPNGDTRARAPRELSHLCSGAHLHPQRGVFRLRARAALRRKRATNRRSTLLWRELRAGGSPKVSDTENGSVRRDQFACCASRGGFRTRHARGTDPGRCQTLGARNSGRHQRQLVMGSGPGLKATARPVPWGRLDFVRSPQVRGKDQRWVESGHQRCCMGARFLFGGQGPCGHVLCLMLIG